MGVRRNFEEFIKILKSSQNFRCENEPFVYGASTHDFVILSTFHCKSIKNVM